MLLDKINLKLSFSKNLWDLNRRLKLPYTSANMQNGGTLYNDMYNPGFLKQKI